MGGHVDHGEIERRGHTVVQMYSTREICEQCGGVAHKQLRAWVHRGLVSPSWHTDDGAYLWRVEDVARIRAVRDEYLARLDRLGRAVGRSA